MRRPIWSLGVLVGLAGAAHAVPTIDCSGLGELVGAEAGLVSVDDEVFEISVRAERQAAPRAEVRARAGLVGFVHPEDFCADRGGLIAFILPVPKVSPGAPGVDPDLPDPGVGPGPAGPSAGLGRTVGGSWGLNPGKSPQGSDLEEEAPEDEVEAPPPMPQEGPPPPTETEPAPSPSRVPESRPVEAVAGCAAGPGAPGAGPGWLLAALLLLRRKGGAR